MRVVWLLFILCMLPVVAEADAPSVAPEDETELVRVEARLADIDAQTGLRGPIALMADGLGATAALDLAALIYLGVVWIDAGSYGGIDERHQRNLRWMTGLSLVTLAIGGGGAIWFARRMRARRALAPERLRLLERRQTLRDALQISADAASVSMQLRVRF